MPEIIQRPEIIQSKIVGIRSPLIAIEGGVATIVRVTLPEIDGWVARPICLACRAGSRGGMGFSPTMLRTPIRVQTPLSFLVEIECASRIPDGGWSVTGWRTLTPWPRELEELPVELCGYGPMAAPPSLHSDEPLASLRLIDGDGQVNKSELVRFCENYSLGVMDRLSGCKALFPPSEQEPFEYIKDDMVWAELLEGQFPRDLHGDSYRHRVIVVCFKDVQPVSVLPSGYGWAAHFDGYEFPAAVVLRYSRDSRQLVIYPRQLNNSEAIAPYRAPHPHVEGDRICLDPSLVEDLRAAFAMDAPAESILGLLRYGLGCFHIADAMPDFLSYFHVAICSACGAVVVDSDLRDGYCQGCIDGFPRCEECGDVISDSDPLTECNTCGSYLCYRCVDEWQYHNSDWNRCPRCPAQVICGRCGVAMAEDHLRAVCRSCSTVVCEQCMMNWAAEPDGGDPNRCPVCYDNEPRARCTYCSAAIPRDEPRRLCTTCNATLCQTCDAAWWGPEVHCGCCETIIPAAGWSREHPDGQRCAACSQRPQAECAHCEVLIPEGEPRETCPSCSATLCQNCESNWVLEHPAVYPNDPGCPMCSTVRFTSQGQGGQDGETR